MTTYRPPANSAELRHYTAEQWHRGPLPPDDVRAIIHAPGRRPTAAREPVNGAYFAP